MYTGINILEVQNGMKLCAELSEIEKIWTGRKSLLKYLDRNNVFTKLKNLMVKSGRFLARKTKEPPKLSSCTWSCNVLA